MRTSLICAAVLAATVPGAAADEGMYTFDNFPSPMVKAKYGVDVTAPWLDRVRGATVRLANCTASFVSSDGLLLTNHHCVEGCMTEHSTKERSLLDEGFVARDRDAELSCHAQIADVLVEMEDITAKVGAATGHLEEREANDKRKALLTDLESACEAAAARDPKAAPLRCESVTLYEGGQYFLYKYKRYSDVRAVFAPEAAIASFGGDPDNFQFPRWSLDFALLRVYESGKPAATPNHLSIDFAGPAAGDAVFVPGHPGNTKRLETLAELETLRKLVLPQTLMRGSELRGRFLQFAKENETHARITEGPLYNLENTLKVRRRQLDALLEGALFQSKAAQEADLRAKIAAKPELKSVTGDPFAEIEAAERTFRELYTPYSFIEESGGFYGQLFKHARTLVRGTVEREKPNNTRLREYTDSKLPRLEQQLGTPSPIYPEVEQLAMGFSLERMREYLGPDHPLVRKLLATESPDSLAKRLIAGTTLGDPTVRMRLWKSGRTAVEAANDAMIQLALSLEPESRALRRRVDDSVEAPIRKASERLARARFAVHGTRVYPDATFTLRLNFGSVQGWKENGTMLEPFTTLRRLYERATGHAPFRLPQTWLRAKDSLDMNTLVNFTSNNDIVGGNSGSAVVNGKGAVVGLAFDGNIHSISGAYWFDAEKNRMISVHPAIIKAALTKVYGAQAVYKELGGK